MNQEPVPIERLNFFLEKLELDDRAQERLAPWRQIFLEHSEEFGREFCGYFLGIARTKQIIEQGEYLPNLEKVLGSWFHALFKEEFSAGFLNYLWNSGVRHVRLNLDQRFVNLGYAMARQFCHRLVSQEIPVEEQEAVIEVVDRMLDFCVLVATDSFITTTFRCDRRMIEGIAHQVRNPITIIGGSIRRLQKDRTGQPGLYRLRDGAQGERAPGAHDGRYLHVHRFVPGRAAGQGVRPGRVPGVGPPLGGAAGPHGRHGVAAGTGPRL